MHGAAPIGAATGPRVALVERNRMSGDCLWTGCVPSKSLLAATELGHRMRNADPVGLKPLEPEIDFATVMAHIDRARQTIEQPDSTRGWRRPRMTTTAYDYAELDRAITAGRAYGFAKLVGDPQGRPVGATVAAPAGGEASPGPTGITG